ncbi:MAG: NAD(P)-binding protein [Acidobacteria bacterium]|nr:NAD(P)-binding protein [Acidobacteriota bacterium]
MSVDVLVVGAGISGIAAAQRCADAGLRVRVLDRGRRIGGRLAARTAEGHSVDLGAPYCTVSDDRFRAVAERWIERGLLREWTDTFQVGGPGGLGEAKSGPMRYGAPAGMRSLVEDLARGLAVEQRVVGPIGSGAEVDGEPARVVVLAMPGPQAERLLRDHQAELAAAADQPYGAGIAVVGRFAERTWPEFDAAFVSDLPIRWLADDGRSHGDGAPVLVAHTTQEFGAAHLDDPDAAIAPALDAMRLVLDTALEPETVFAHRWTFAQPTAGRERTFLLDPETGIGLCGDGWSERSRVEAAWLSGDDLGTAIVERLA